MPISSKFLFSFDGLVEEKKELEKLMTTNDRMKSKVQKVVREALKVGRDMLAEHANSVLTDDPRQAYRAVRSIVYRRILGGNLNILNKRRAGIPKALPGRHRERSAKTIAMQSYWGSDRGFILRWLSDGVSGRTASTMNNHPIKRTQRPKGKRIYKDNIGNRGDITGNHWFYASSHAAIQKAAQELCDRIDELINKELNKK